VLSGYAVYLDGRCWHLNVYPKATIGDPAYLLNRKLDRVSFVESREADGALTPISQKLPFEQVGYSQMGGSVTFNKPWSVTFSNVTVREVVNRIARHLGARAGWIFAGSREQRRFSFHKTEFAPVSEYTWIVGNVTRGSAFSPQRRELTGTP